MTDIRNCRYCGSRLAHLQGATGRISICSRCGWNRVDLTSHRGRQGLKASPGRWVAWAQVSVSEPSLLAPIVGGGIGLMTESSKGLHSTRRNMIEEK